MRVARAADSKRETHAEGIDDSMMVCHPSAWSLCHGSCRMEKQAVQEIAMVEAGILAAVGE